MHAVLGSTLVVEAELDPSRAVRRLSEHKIEAIFGVPLIYEVMAKAPAFADADLSSLITATVGGAAVPVPLLEEVGGQGRHTAPDLRHGRGGRDRHRDAASRSRRAPQLARDRLASRNGRQEKSGA